MKCFSTKPDKNCLKCMQDKEYSHSLTVDQEKVKNVVEVDDEVSLKLNRSYEVNESFIREQRKAKLPTELGLSDQSTLLNTHHKKDGLRDFVTQIQNRRIYIYKASIQNLVTFILCLRFYSCCCFARVINSYRYSSLPY